MMRRGKPRHFESVWQGPTPEQPSQGNPRRTIFAYASNEQEQSAFTRTPRIPKRAKTPEETQRELERAAEAEEQSQRFLADTVSDVLDLMARKAEAGDEDPEELAARIVQRILRKDQVTAQEAYEVFRDAKEELRYSRYSSRDQDSDS